MRGDAKDLGGLGSGYQVGERRVGEVFLEHVLTGDLKPDDRPVRPAGVERGATIRGSAWANRRRLLRARERLTQQQFTKMRDEILAQEATGELLAAWIAKGRTPLHARPWRQHPPRSEVSNRLFAFYDWCARADVPEVTTLARTVEAWWPQILAFIGTGVTNAGTEVNNRLIKDAARIAFSFRNLDNQRRRVRLHCKRTTIS